MVNRWCDRLGYFDWVQKYRSETKIKWNRSNLRVVDLFSSPCSKNNSWSETDSQFQEAVKEGCIKKDGVKRGVKKNKWFTTWAAPGVWSLHSVILSQYVLLSMVCKDRLSMLCWSIFYEQNLKTTSADQDECTKNTYRTGGVLQLKA